jgi:hypothetical protein
MREADRARWREGEPAEWEPDRAAGAATCGEAAACRPRLQLVNWQPYSYEWWMPSSRSVPSTRCVLSRSSSGGWSSRLCGGLSISDAPNPTPIGASTIPEAESRGRLAGVLLIVINPEWFGNGEHHQRMARETVDVAKSVAPAPGVMEILVPGEPEVRTRERREREGIFLPAAMWKDLVKVAQRFGAPISEEFLSGTK